MAKYVLGPEGARKFRELCAAKSAGGRRGGGGPAPVFAVEFAAPYTVRWAASLASDETSEGAGDSTEGEWIIWLPTPGLLKVGAASVDITSDLDDAGGDYPEGWYKLGDALDADAGGTLYLNVTLGSSPSAEFSDTPGGASNPVSIKICEASVGSDGARTVMQFVTSVLVIGATGEDHDTITYADEISTSRAYGGNGSEGRQHCNILSIYGFGRFHDASANVRGFFSPSSDMEISEYDHTPVAFLARSGNTDVVGGNMVAYRRVKVKGVAEPFKFVEDVDVDPDTGETVVSRRLANCQFWFGGELHTLPDVAVAANTTYYLNIVGAQDPSTGDMAWTFGIGSSPAASGDSVMCVPLYAIGNDCRPVMDYRAATLSFALPDKVFTFNDEPVAHVYADDDIDVGTKEIVGGAGVDVEDDGETITISADVSLVAGPGVVVTDGVIGVNPDGKSVDIVSGSGNARKVQLLGFDSPATNATSDTLGEALVTSGGSTRYLLVAVPSDGGVALAYMPLDQLAVDADEKSGLVFATVADGNSSALRLDWSGRSSGDTIALRDLTVYGSNGTAQTTAKMPATASVVIPGVKGGRGTTITSDDNGTTRRVDATVADIQSDSTELGVTRDANGVVHLSFNGSGGESGGGGGSDEGYSGSIKSCLGLEYNVSTHQFTATFLSYTVSNGLIMSGPTSSVEPVFTAVEETV